MYKRPAHILFVESVPAVYARLAQATTARIGGPWLEGRAASMQTGDSNAPAQKSPFDGTGDSVCPTLSSALLDWADLVVVLDAACERRCPPLPPGTRGKRWFLSALEGGEAAASVEEIEAGVASMVGGLRMLARSDADGSAAQSPDQETDD